MEQGEGTVTDEQAAHEDAKVLAELSVEAFPDSMMVVSHNADAIRLYERLGFELGPLKQSRLLRWAIGRPGDHKIVRPFA